MERLKSRLRGRITRLSSSSDCTIAVDGVSDVPTDTQATNNNINTNDETQETSLRVLSLSPLAVTTTAEDPANTVNNNAATSTSTTSSSMLFRGRISSALRKRVNKNHCDERNHDDQECNKNQQDEVQPEYSTTTIIIPTVNVGSTLTKQQSMQNVVDEEAMEIVASTITRELASMNTTDNMVLSSVNDDDVKPSTEASILDEEGSTVTSSCCSSSDDTDEQRFVNFPEDPSVQESIECILAFQQQQQRTEDDASTIRFSNTFSSQHQIVSALTPTRVVDGWSAHHQTNSGASMLLSPSSLQQSIVKSRSAYNSGLFPPPTTRRVSSKMTSSASNCENTFFLDSNRRRNSTKLETPELASCSSTCCDNGSVIKPSQEPEQCMCRRQFTPAMIPEHWPQRPLLLRPTLNSGMVIHGVRFSSSSKDNYLWKATDDDTFLPSESWPTALAKHWGRSIPKKNDDVLMCPNCVILPLNNGTEKPGEALVIDFESNTFNGTMLIRVRDAVGTTQQQQQTTKGYFEGLNRRYQVVVRGQFKESIPWTECLAGVQLESPIGKLPSKWMMKTALNVISFFAPQIQSKIDGPRPYSLTPLGSTPQSLIVHSAETDDDLTHGIDMETPLEEPTDASITLLGSTVATSKKSTSHMQRARHRKKTFDKLFAQQSKELQTDPSKVYTFEFLQHLLQFDTFAIDLGSVVGSVPLQAMLNGKPLQIMASHRHPTPISTATNSNRIWAFDLWHELLIPDAHAVDATDAPPPVETKL